MRQPLFALPNADSKILVYFYSPVVLCPEIERRLYFCVFGKALADGERARGKQSCKILRCLLLKGRRYLSK